MTSSWHPVPLHNRDMVDLMPGTILSGHFVLGGPAVLSADGGGLWRAVDVATGTSVLVKILAARPADDAVAQARFRFVARALTGWSDPGIAPVRECGEFVPPDGPAYPYIIRDLVPGPTLAQRLGRGPLPAEEALRLVAAVAEALAAAHRTGVVHGHLEPRNVILGEHGVRVTDFGLAPLRDLLPGTGSLPGAGAGHRGTVHRGRGHLLAGRAAGLLPVRNGGRTRGSRRSRAAGAVPGRGG